MLGYSTKTRTEPSSLMTAGLGARHFSQMALFYKCLLHRTFIISVAEDGVQLLVIDILVDGFNSSKDDWKKVEKNINEMTEKVRTM